NKLAIARIPILIAHTANDPIAPVQTLGNMIAKLKNQNIAATILPTGGHIGFAPYVKNWYYSTILSFFDPKKGPKPTPASN
ncbi:MAG: hypothetical protein GY794_12445, partial [bacterium]|nr:hypothetical protein [bacterium]